MKSDEYRVTKLEWDYDDQKTPNGQPLWVVVTMACGHSVKAKWGPPVYCPVKVGGLHPCSDCRKTCVA